MSKITAERLHQLLTYYPLSGLLIWKISTGTRAAAGSIAGCLTKNGYVIIGIEGKVYPAHVLAWVMMTGEWPTDDVDHRDRNRSNNRWRNLRAATRAQNQRNRGLNRNNTSGVRGVSRTKTADKWQVSIRVDGKLIYLGCYVGLEEATEVRRKAEKHYFGEFRGA